MGGGVGVRLFAIFLSTQTMSNKFLNNVALNARLFVPPEFQLMSRFAALPLHCQGR